MIKVIRNVLNKTDLFSLHKGLVSNNMWSLNNYSTEDSLGRVFPGVLLIEKGEVIYNDSYWIGYFNCLFDRINAELQKQHNFYLQRRIERICLNAANDNSYTDFHQDSSKTTYSIVGFLTPQWAEDWGGELNIEGEVIKYNPGDFILFNSNQLHSSQPIKKIPYWRTSVSYVIHK